jgi:predicted ATPase
VREPLRHPETLTTGHGVTTLRTQVENWASTIIRPIRITAQWPPGITASLIRFQEPELIRQRLLSELIRPANMGFGFSYALPILVAGLLVPETGVLIVENPEAHLHPAGQSRLGRFLARVAGSGAQVIVETHSDHVINGIRLAAVEDRVIDPNAVVMYFFSDEPGNSPTAIQLNGRGALSSWPKGFFDQIEEDLGRIANAKRRNG